MEFLGQAIEILKVLVIALGGALVFQETFKWKAGAWVIICKDKKMQNYCDAKKDVGHIL